MRGSEVCCIWMRCFTNFRTDKDTDNILSRASFMRPSRFGQCSTVRRVWNQHTQGPNARPRSPHWNRKGVNRGLGHMRPSRPDHNQFGLILG